MHPVMTWNELLSHLLDLAVAYALAFPIGWDREREARSAGIRTFPIVAVASCSFILIANAILGERSADQSRVLQGLITGIGFIGGGAILKDGAAVIGTATAASLWSTGIMGAAVGFGLYDIGIVLSVLNLATLRLLLPLKKHTASSGSKPETSRPS